MTKPADCIFFSSLFCIPLAKEKPNQNRKQQMFFTEAECNTVPSHKSQSQQISVYGNIFQQKLGQILHDKISMADCPQGKKKSILTIKTFQYISKFLNTTPVWLCPTLKKNTWNNNLKIKKSCMSYTLQSFPKQLQKSSGFMCNTTAAHS